ncbi:MAG: DNRLRE domain-containing protein, partial [Crocinitomicaceae bacterium]|nr:DNRLRE domain-containing protein [Crocinitomicaceae bacterium]
YLLYYTNTGDGDRQRGDYQYFYSLEYPITGGWLHTATVKKFEMDFDPTLEFAEADLHLYSPGTYHVEFAGKDNSCTMKLITEDWQESVVTWNNRPDTIGENSIAVPGTNGNQYRDDIIDILDFVEFWQRDSTENHGFDFSLNSYSNLAYTRLIYGSSDRTVAADRPELHLKFTVKPKLEIEWDNNNHDGDITVNAPAGNLPYTYLISKDSLPIMDSLWSYLKDSTGIDSAGLWNGQINSRKYTFEGLSSGRYYISVYDNTGDRLLNEIGYVNPDILVANSTGLIQTGEVLTVDLANQNTEAYINFKHKVFEQEDGGISFVVNNLSGTFEFGFNDEDDAAVTSFTDFEYGIKATSNGLELLKDNVVFSTSTVSAGDELSIYQRNNSIEYYKNGVLLASEDIEGIQYINYNTEARITGTQMSVTLVHFDKYKPRRVHSYISHASCGAPLGGKLTYKTSVYYGTTLNSIDLTEVGNASNTHVSSTGEITGLSPGIYTLTGFWSDGGTSTETVYIGYDILWKETATLDIAGDDVYYPLAYAYPSIAPSGNVESKNTSDDSETNWVVYEQTNYVSNTSGTLSLENASGEKLAQVTIYTTPASFSTLQVRDYDNNVQTLTAPPGYAVFPLPGITSAMMVGVFDAHDIRIEENLGVIKVFYNNYEISSFTSGHTGEDMAHIDIRANNALVYKDVIASFCGEENILSYADVTPKLDGGYYKAFGGTLKFIYEEQYNDQDNELSYNIYDNENTVVVTGTGDELVYYGDNRYELDFSCAAGPGHLTDGVYVLEVINEKNEKWYLRFKVIENC